ncbi:poly(A) polymerase I [Gammaproteobacteria bacterium]
MRTISQPVIVPRPNHIVSRAQISDAALKVLYQLMRAGYDAYLVGGGVRDLLLGRTPKDFDVATNARPEQIKEVFRNCHLIGRRFLLAHVRFGHETIEVATFRAAHTKDTEGQGAMEGGRITLDNVYGTLDQDAWRRDFTVNALYYNIRDFSVVDFSRGLQDLEAKVLRIMGEPINRYREDPVRMLRAVRLSSKLGFSIDPATEAPISKFGYLLRGIPPARLFEEVLKLFFGGAAVQTFAQLKRYGLFTELFPLTAKVLTSETATSFLSMALSNTDARVAIGKPVTPAFLFATLLWEPVRKRMSKLSGLSPLEAIQESADLILQEQSKRVMIPRRYLLQVQEIWTTQARFLTARGKRAKQLSESSRFRAAYDFLLLRVASGEELKRLGEYWTRVEQGGLTGTTVDEEECEPSPAPELVLPAPAEVITQKKTRRRSPKKPPPV